MARPLSFHLRAHRRSPSNPSNSSTPPTPTTPASVTMGDPTLPPTLAKSAAQSPTMAAVTAARAEIRKKTRTDWVYPLPEPPFDLRVGPSTTYVPRTTDSLSSSSSPSPSQVSALAAPAGWNPSHRIDRKAASDPYRFDSPEAVGKSVAERKMKRRREEREELSANEGLRIFEERRDAWTGTVRVRNARGRGLVHKEVLELIQDEKVENAKKKNNNCRTPHGRDDNLEQTSSPTEDQVKPTDKKRVQGADLAPAMDNDSLEHRPPTEDPDYQLMQPLPTETDSTVVGEALPSPSDSESDLDRPSALTPLSLPLLPTTNPTRAMIVPRAYPTIYTRVVVQGSAPRLPIPLQDIINSCVGGWQRDGEWPPKQGTMEPLVGRRRKDATGALGRGMRRVLRIVGKGDVDGPGNGRGVDSGDGLIDGSKI